jgi:hypothetical protein
MSFDIVDINESLGQPIEEGVPQQLAGFGSKAFGALKSAAGGVSKFAGQMKADYNRGRYGVRGNLSADDANKLLMKYRQIAQNTEDNLKALFDLGNEARALDPEGNIEKAADQAEQAMSAYGKMFKTIIGAAASQAQEKEQRRASKSTMLDQGDKDALAAQQAQPEPAMAGESILRSPKNRSILG